jgi:large subunit ribosomal protein L21
MPAAAAPWAPPKQPSADCKKPVRTSKSEHRGRTHEDKTMFAVIKTGGKQYRVAADDKLEVEKIAGEPGEIIQFGEVLAVGGDTVTVGTPLVAGASVAAEVLARTRGPKVIAFKKRRRKNSRRKRGHRQEYTLVQITEILTDGAKPTGRKAERKSKSAAAAPSATPDTGTDAGTAASP